MQKDSFVNLTLNEKVLLLYKEATFIMSIRYYGYKVNLFLLDKCYFEIFYNHKRDCIERIEILDTAHTRMKFYSDQIKLPQDWVQ